MITCFPCKGPHQVFECLKHGKLSVLVIKEERQEMKGRIASMTLVVLCMQRWGRMYVETEVEGKKFQAIVDMGGNIAYMAKE